MEEIHTSPFWTPTHMTSSPSPQDLTSAQIPAKPSTWIFDNWWVDPKLRDALLPKPTSISVKQLVCYMTSPLAFTSSPFPPLYSPQEIYKISLHNAPLLYEVPNTSSYAYKKVANRTYPVVMTLPKHFWIGCQIPTNPLENMPTLPFPHPTSYQEYATQRNKWKLWKSTITDSLPLKKKNWSIT
jgi:hypothetical protein